jgi:hypothetical protein
MQGEEMKRIPTLLVLLTVGLSAWGQTKRKLIESWKLAERNYQTNRCTFIWFAAGKDTLRVTTVCAANTTLMVGDVVEPMVGIIYNTHHGWDVFVEPGDAVFVNIDTKARETFRFIKEEVVR